MAVSRSGTQNLKISEILSAAREQANLSQQALADRSGLSRAYISCLEAGIKADPSLSTLLAFALGCGVTVSELLADL